VTTKMLASKGAHLILAIAVAVVTFYAAGALSGWLLVPGIVLLALLLISLTDLLETIAIHRALRSIRDDERFAELSADADRLLASGMAEEAEEAYLAAAEHRDDRAAVIARYMQMAHRSRELGDNKGARKWLDRAKATTTR
jgi:hypothetical protein